MHIQKPIFTKPLEQLLAARFNDFANDVTGIHNLLHPLVNFILLIVNSLLGMNVNGHFNVEKRYDFYDFIHARNIDQKIT